MRHILVLLSLIACDSITDITITLEVPEGLAAGSIVVEVDEEGEEWPTFTGMHIAGEVCDGTANNLTLILSDTGPCHANLELSAWFVEQTGCGAELPTESQISHHGQQDPRLLMLLVHSPTKMNSH